MSVINQMNRDLKRRQGGDDNALSPVLTNLPWWHGLALFKSVAVLILVGLTLVSGYLLWFAEPRSLPREAVVADTVANTDADTEITVKEAMTQTSTELSLSSDKVKASQSAEEQGSKQAQQPTHTRQTIDAQSQAMLAAVTSSDGNKIKVLDAKVVFISDFDTPNNNLAGAVVDSDTESADQAVNETASQVATTATSAAAVVSFEPSVLPSAPPVSAPTSEPVESNEQQVAVQTPSTDGVTEPTVISESSVTSTSVISTPEQPVASELTVKSEPSVAPAISAKSDLPVASELNEKSEPSVAPAMTAKSTPEPIAIVPVAQTKPKHAQRSNHNTASRSVNEEVKIKPTPSGPSSLSIKPVELTESELIALYQKQARAAKTKGDLGAAQSRLQKALTLDPRHVEVRKELAALHYGRGEYSQAMSVLEQGVTLVPSNADFRLMQARIYLAGQQQAQALQVLDALTPNVANNQDYYATKAALSQQLNQDKKALEAYLALARIQPKQGKWWLGLAISQEKLGQQEQALRSYQQAELVGGLSLASMDYVKGRIAVLQ